MNWDGIKGTKIIGALGNSVFQPKHNHYPADGTGRDIHCFTNPRPIDSMIDEPVKFNTSTNQTGRNKSPTIT